MHDSATKIVALTFVPCYIGLHVKVAGSVPRLTFPFFLVTEFSGEEPDLFHSEEARLLYLTPQSYKATPKTMCLFVTSHLPL